MQIVFFICTFAKYVTMNANTYSNPDGEQMEADLHETKMLQVLFSPTHNTCNEYFEN